MANATDMMLHNTLRRIKNLYRTNGQTVSEDDMLEGLSKYCDMVRRAVITFNDKVEPRVNGATFKTGGAKSYEGFQDDSREMAQLALLYIDRTARNGESCEKVFKTLRELPKGNLFTDADIQRYEKQQ